jgi:hypothetical protein
MAAFSHDSLYSKSKVYVERALKHYREGDDEGFQLWW